MSKLEELIQELCPDGVEYKKLGEIASISRGGSLQKKISPKMVYLVFTMGRFIPDMNCLLMLHFHLFRKNLQKSRNMRNQLT